MNDHRVRVLEFQIHGKPEEGYLSVMEWGKQIPFKIARTFITYDTPPSVIRGRHAHYNTEMVIIAVCGSIILDTEDRYGHKEQIVLNAPSVGVFLPKLCWHTMRYAPGSIQVVLASTNYNRQDYIADYTEFSRIQQSNIRE